MHSNIQKLLIATSLVLLVSACAPVRFPWPADNKQDKPDKPESSQVHTMNPGYDRLRSRVLVRKILRPTRANLDYAAYHANVMTLNPVPEQLPPPASMVPAQDRIFGGVLVPGSVVSSIEQTPLTEAERATPLAFSPLVDVLSRWDYSKAQPLDEARTSIRSESWGNPKSIQVTTQQATELYRHEDSSQGTEQWWVKIEFAPWAAIFENMPDEDGDGYPEIYGRLAPRLISRPVMDYTRKQYAEKLLDAPQVKAWVNELASYWYPSYNTDVFDMAGSKVWPTEDTEPEVLAELHGLKFENPTAIIIGKPRGKPVYNVFLVEGISLSDHGATSAKEQKSSEPVNRTISAITQPQKKLLSSQLEKQGDGSWEKWAKKVSRFHKQLKNALAKRPSSLKALVGRDGFLFFRNSIRYVIGGDLQKQPAGKNPFRTIVDFKDYLAEQGVDFLFVPIPTKLEVFPDKFLHGKFRLGSLPVLNPYGRKLLMELSEAGVEIIDLLPVFLKDRSAQKKGQELSYQAQDTHWTDRGLRIAARMIAERIKKYPWYKEIAKKPVNFTQTKVTFKHEGDLVSRLADREKNRYKPQTLVGWRVSGPDEKPYDDDPQSPIVVLGDSFTGVYERTYCRNAGVSAHIARLIDYPVDLVMSYGGGPNVRKKLLRRGLDSLRSKRLVIWMFAARDLYDYWEDWEPLTIPKNP